MDVRAGGQTDGRKDEWTDRRTRSGKPNEDWTLLGKTKGIKFGKYIYFPPNLLAFWFNTILFIVLCCQPIIDKVQERLMFVAGLLVVCGRTNLPCLCENLSIKSIRCNVCLESGCMFYHCLGLLDATL